MPYNTHMICITCHKKGDTIKKTKLLKLSRLCQGLDDDTSTPHNFAWGLNSHCPYGISCAKLNSYDAECKRLARSIEPKLVTAALTDTSKYREILHLLQGDFPSVYRNLEIIHHKKGKTHDSK